MKLKFKHLDYQYKASMSVVNLFKGQPNTLNKLLVDRILKNKGNIYEALNEYEDISIYSNKELKINRNTILKNLQEVQKDNGLKVDEKLETLNNILNFTIDMETGTGKTYVYTKTMFELNKHYGWNKFIIMVPSIAIREGVYKSLEITQEHFYEDYKKKIKFFIYDTKNSSNLINIKNFADTSDIEVIIMNYQAFNTKSKDARKIYQELDSTNSERPIDLIKRANPILIIDEPQRFGLKAEEKFKEFNPLFILRYSATHKKIYNKVYKLDAIDAYNEKLVKKIGVIGIEQVSSNATDSYLYLDKIVIGKEHNPIAYIEMEIKTATGIKREIKKIRYKDNLYEISGELAEYKDGFVVTNIDALENKIEFLNGLTLEVGKINGNKVNEDILRKIQIRETIKKHFEKELKLFKKGIKVLSLFFIDEVAKYRQYDNNGELKGEYAKFFEDEYNKIKDEFLNNKDIDEEYKKYLNSLDTEKVHNGYFSIDKNGHYINSKETKSEGGSNDVSAYDLIMKDKERLLSFEEPTRFIFSHSALREGWDNPNVFQICTLRHTQSEISKRQEIGRGLRICVNKDGERMDVNKIEDEFFDINYLTIIANESYDNFAKALQNEILETLKDRIIALPEEIFKTRIYIDNNGNEINLKPQEGTLLYAKLIENEYLNEKNEVTNKFIEELKENKIDLGERFHHIQEDVISFLYEVYENRDMKIPLENDKKYNVDIIKLKPNDNFNKKEFQELWEYINKKSIYQVNFDSQELINLSINEINKNLKVDKITAKIIEGEQKEKFEKEDLAKNNAMEIKEDRVEYTTVSISNVPLKYDVVEEIKKETKLLRKTIVKILQGISEEKFDMFKENPEDFILKISKIINNIKATTLINNIEYNLIDDSFSNDIFTINNFKGKLEENTIEVKKHIYDYLQFDSIVEKEFAKNGLEKGEQIEVYAKLPKTFKINTPIGNYNPDWAIVINDNNEKHIYFIAETKGSMESMDLRQKESLKIKYAQKHFEAINNYLKSKGKKVKYEHINNFDNLMKKTFEN
ncbi:MAG: type restriction enzyme [Fusobacteriaceae bacterium]|nr:type restriction enzyme [Fusobacteriaceae bacterium]